MNHCLNCNKECKNKYQEVIIQKDRYLWRIFTIEGDLIDSYNIELEKKELIKILKNRGFIIN